LGYFDRNEDNILFKMAAFAKEFLQTDALDTKKDLNLIQVLKIKFLGEASSYAPLIRKNYLAAALSTTTLAAESAGMATVAGSAIVSAGFA